MRNWKGPAPRSRPVVGMALMALLSGCGADGSLPAARFQVTDSGGTAWVTNGGGALGSRQASVRQAATVLPDPDRPESLFGNVVDIATDVEGRLYVLDQMAAEVRVFSSDGTFLMTIGRGGQGPGEFSSFAQSLWISGDTLTVADAGHRVLHRFGLDGTPISADPQPGDQAGRMWAEVLNGVLYARSLALGLDEGGAWTAEDKLLRARGGGAAETLFVFDYPQTDIGRRGDPLVPYLVNAPVWAPRPGGGFVWTHLEGEEVRFHGPAGALERTLSQEEWSRPRATSADVEQLESLMREKMSMMGADPSVVDNLTVVEPEFLPAITGLRAGPGGTIWVQRMGNVSDVHPMAVNAADTPTGWGGSRWEVFDDNGRYRSTVQFPPGFRVLEIEGSLVYGMLRDARDEETLAVFQVEEGQIPAG